ncbi:MAG: hypothetical protein WBV36_12685 [Terriglobales bacterium]
MKNNFTIRITRSASLLFLAVVAASMSLAPRAYGAAPAGRCSTNPDSRALDFWLGDWSIAGPGSEPTAKSSVTSTLDQCVIVETWDGGRGHTGQNWFGYNADDKSWHGMFADNRGRVHVFVDGKVASGAAEFTGPSQGADGEAFLNRVRIVRISPEKVEQIWEKSTDHGATWNTEFRGEYSRKKS